jgi:Family of unknown function (DUF5317)
MFLAVCLLASLASARLAGGRLSALGDLHFRHIWLLAVAFGLQVTIISVVPSGDGWWHQAAHLATYAMAGAFAVANRHIPMLWLIAAGGVMNLAAIAANGGVMPASASALDTAGLPPETGFANSAPVPDAHLAYLGDVFAIPSSWPLANVFSIGDVCIALGALLLVHRVTRSEGCSGSAGRSCPGRSGA